MATKEQTALAMGRVGRIGVIFWGIHDPAEIVERVLADYALIGKVPIDVLKKRAQERVKGLDDETKS